MKFLSDNSLRKLLFSLLGLNGYLTLVRKLFFIAFKTGRLRDDPVYAWHYFVPGIIRSGDVVIDIGANMGYYSTIFSKSVGKKGMVYCVEPVRPLYGQLSRQVGFRDNTRLIPFALGDTNRDDAVFSVPYQFRGLGYLRHGCLSLQTETSDVDGKYSFPVKIRSAQELFAGLSHIDYIKCDIEGYELTVFKDMRLLLTRHHPIVQVEIDSTHLNQVIEIFCGLGYRGYKLRNGFLADIEFLSLEDKIPFDTLFVPAGYFHRIRSFLAPVNPDSIATPPDLEKIKHASLQPDPDFFS